MKSVCALVIWRSWSIATLAAWGTSFMSSLYVASSSKFAMGAPFLSVSLVGTSNHSGAVGPRQFPGGGV